MITLPNDPLQLPTEAIKGSDLSSLKSSDQMKKAHAKATAKTFDKLQEAVNSLACNFPLAWIILSN